MVAPPDFMFLEMLLGSVEPFPLNHLAIGSVDKKKGVPIVSYRAARNEVTLGVSLSALTNGITGAWF